MELLVTIVGFFICIFAFAFVMDFLTTSLNKSTAEKSRKRKRSISQKTLVGNISSIEELDEMMFDTASKFANNIGVKSEDIPKLGNALGIGFLLNAYFTYYIRSKIYADQPQYVEDFYCRDRDLVMGMSTFFLVAKKTYIKQGENLVVGVEGLKHISFLMHKNSQVPLSERMRDWNEIIPLKELFRRYPEEYLKGVETLISTYKTIDINSEYDRYTDDFKELLSNLKMFVFDSPFDKESSYYNF